MKESIDCSPFFCSNLRQAGIKVFWGIRFITMEMRFVVCRTCLHFDLLPNNILKVLSSRLNKVIGNRE